jgi:single-stranded DNA-binding protein
MQKAIEAHEAANGSGGDDNNEDEPAPQRPAAVAKKPVAPKKPVKVQEDEYDDDIPF